MVSRMVSGPETPPVLFVSGGHGYQDLPGPLLRKPFLPEDLSAVVRGVLAR